jgi:adenine-specific DNA-methyltransferase
MAAYAAEAKLGADEEMIVTILAALPPHNGPWIVYGEGCRLGSARVKREGIVFRQIPYEIKVT